MFIKSVCLGNEQERDAQLLGDMEAMTFSKQHY